MIKLLSLLTITLGFLSACSHAPTHVSSKLSKSSKGMTCIAPNVYVDPAMPQQQRQDFLRTVNQSKSEISSFFGGLKSSPKIYACSTSQCFRKFGGVPAKAKTINDDTVLLSKNGLDRTTLSHELAHAEFHKLLGTSHVWNKVPMWFDEGLAVLACKDSKYAKPVPKMPLHHLVSQDQWVNAVRNNKPAYSVARQAVEAWHQEVGTKGLKAMINRLKNGESLTSNNDFTDAPQVSQL
jgi:hypothetical protein